LRFGPFFAAEIAALNPARPEPQMIRSKSNELAIFNTKIVFLG